LTDPRTAIPGALILMLAGTLALDATAWLGVEPFELGLYTRRAAVCAAMLWPMVGLVPRPRTPLQLGVAGLAAAYCLWALISLMTPGVRAFGGVAGLLHGGTLAALGLWLAGSSGRGPGVRAVLVAAGVGPLTATLLAGTSAPILLQATWLASLGGLAIAARLLTPPAA